MDDIYEEYMNYINTYNLKYLDIPTSTIIYIAQDDIATCFNPKYFGLFTNIKYVDYTFDNYIIGSIVIGFVGTYEARKLINNNAICCLLYTSPSPRDV
jgi:hypothetical protein